MKKKNAARLSTVQAANLPSDHAVDALKSLLAQVSAIKVREVRIECTAPSREMLIVAYVDVHHHSHTLVCAVKASDEANEVRNALAELQGRAAEFSSDAVPVFIAPRVSHQTRALCASRGTGFLDLEGNARLHLADFFIGQRSMPPAAVTAPIAAMQARGPQLAGVA